MKTTQITKTTSKNDAINDDFIPDDIPFGGENTEKQVSEVSDEDVMEELFAKVDTYEDVDHVKQAQQEAQDSLNETGYLFPNTTDDDFFANPAPAEDTIEKPIQESIKTTTQRIAELINKQAPAEKIEEGKTKETSWTEEVMDNTGLSEDAIIESLVNSTQTKDVSDTVFSDLHKKEIEIEGEKYVIDDAAERSKEIEGAEDQYPVKEVDSFGDKIQTEPTTYQQFHPEDLVPLEAESKSGYPESGLSEKERERMHVVEELIGELDRTIRKSREYIDAAFSDKTDKQKAMAYNSVKRAMQDVKRLVNSKL